MTKSTDNTFDLIIVGGGMVGASLALALADSSMNIALIDQGSLEPEPVQLPSPFSPRVSALTEASVNLFKNLGVWQAMTLQRVCPYQAITVWDGEGTGEIHFDASSVARDSIGYIVENCVIRNALLAGLSKTPITLYEKEAGIRFQLDHDKGTLILANGQQLQGKLLVAADGAESSLRNAANIPLSRKDYMHHAIVTTVETEQYHQDTAWQVFLDTGPLAFLPLPSINNKHYCSIVWSLVPESAETIMGLDDNAFCQALETAFEARLGTVIHADPRFRYPLCQRHAQQYYQNPVVLAGDAAHTIHPLAGQGVNLGLMDVAVLTEELLRAKRRQDDIAGSHILGRYQRRRKGHNMTMMGAMSGFQNLFATDDIAVRWLRNTGLKAFNKLPLIKDLLIRQAIGTYGELPELVKN
ncbi:FAD-dependent monooxygenase [Endozoicomonas sp. Mp262]|uniref:FAD-dependent monooxygenase n=1 Tax=Endozoicomonas sp. Mp262 TaxID=2919499 RepID=UPI0021D94163